MAGELLDISAFDQPGVEQGKLIAHGLLGRPDLSELAEQVRHEQGASGEPLSAIAQKE
jgi:glucose-6-phosphate isomerase